MFDTEQLKTLAAKAVSEYLTKQVPLTDTVAALSRTNQLNTEQTRRLVEATNQVAYLKILESAKDRTFNFPVAVYEDVMAKVASPEGIMSKQASEGRKSPLSIVTPRANEGLEKAASENVLGDVAEYLTKAAAEEIVPYVVPLIFSYRAELQKLAFEMPNTAERMLPIVDVLLKDDLLEAKLVKSASKHAGVMTTLFGLEMEKAASVAAGYIFKEADLKKVAELDSLIDEYQAMEARSEFLRSELEKVSFMAVSGRLAGSIFGAKTTGVAGAKGVKELLTGDVKASASHAGKNNVVRGYQGYPGVEKSAAAGAPSGTGLPPAGPTPSTGAGSRSAGVKPSFSNDVAEKWKKGLIYKMLPKGLTWSQRGERLMTGADYLFMRESIAPKHSVWDSLHNKGDAQ